MTASMLAFSLNTSDFFPSTLAPNSSQEAINMMHCCGTECSYNQRDDCQSLYMTFLMKHKLTFTNYHVVRITLTWILFGMSAFGNLLSLWSLLRCQKSFNFKFRNFTNAQIMMLNITLADIAYTFLILPVDAMWQYTQQWQAGNAACKVLHVLKYFAMYSSSGMIMAMALDRMLCILRQLTASQQRQQVRICLITAWLFAVVNSIPAGILFGLASMKLCKDKCEDEIPEVTQCVDFGLVPDLRYYYIYTMMISFFIPITSIIICQTMIGVEISRMANRDREMMGRRHSETTNSINRARKKSLLLTVLITTMFCVCWGPYYVRGLYYWFNRESVVNKWLELWMLMSMYFNPCLHPLFFAIFMKDVRRPFVAIARKIRPLFFCIPYNYLGRKKLSRSATQTDENIQMLTTITKLNSDDKVTSDEDTSSPSSRDFGKKLTFSDMKDDKVICRTFQNSDF